MRVLWVLTGLVLAVAASMPIARRDSALKYPATAKCEHLLSNTASMCELYDIVESTSPRLRHVVGMCFKNVTCQRNFDEALHIECSVTDATGSESQNLTCTKTYVEDHSSSFDECQLERINPVVCAQPIPWCDQNPSFENLTGCGTYLLENNGSLPTAHTHVCYDITGVKRGCSVKSSGVSEVNWQQECSGLYSGLHECNWGDAASATGEGDNAEEMSTPPTTLSTERPLVARSSEFVTTWSTLTPVPTSLLTPPTNSSSSSKVKYNVVETVMVTGILFGVFVVMMLIIVSMKERIRRHSCLKKPPANSPRLSSTLASRRDFGMAQRRTLQSIELRPLPGIPPENRSANYIGETPTTTAPSEMIFVEHHHHHHHHHHDEQEHDDQTHGPINTAPHVNNDAYYSDHSDTPLSVTRRNSPTDFDGNNNAAAIRTFSDDLRAIISNANTNTHTSTNTNTNTHTSTNSNADTPVFASSSSALPTTTINTDTNPNADSSTHSTTANVAVNPVHSNLHVGDEEHVYEYHDVVELNLTPVYNRRTSKHLRRHNSNNSNNSNNSTYEDENALITYEDDDKLPPTPRPIMRTRSRTMSSSSSTSSLTAQGFGFSAQTSSS